MPSIPNSYLATLLNLRSEFIGLDGDTAEFDELFNMNSNLTLSQINICRRIFQQTFDLWSTRGKMEDIYFLLAVLVDCIPMFSKYEKEETACMILKMVFGSSAEKYIELVQSQLERNAESYS
jgi:hypothetical protein